MKKIYFIIAALVMVISWMVYLYFSSLNTSSSQSDQSLRLVARNAALVFSFQNDKSVIDILNGQDLFNRIIGTEKTKAMQSLRKALAAPGTNGLIQRQDLFIGFYPGKTTNLEFMVGIMVNAEVLQKTIPDVLKKSKIELRKNQAFYELYLADSSKFYFAIKDRVLLLASSPDIIQALDNKTNKDAEQGFMTFIQKNDRLAKNSLANLYINYKQLPLLMKSVTPYFNRGELALLNNQHAYARMSYNFSKEKVFFSGETKVENKDSYYSLFQQLKPEKIDLDKILPDNTASYTLYSFGDFRTFTRSLKAWFEIRKENREIQQRIQAINQKYRLNLDEIFPQYTGTQAVTFQLQNKQKLAAVRLTNGDKVDQLLLDLSDDYDGKIRLLKEPGLLYYYFGEPFKKFDRPYYLILNNYIVFAPYASSLQDFQNKYQNNSLLIMDPDYSEVYKQLPLTSNILFYINNNKAQNTIISTIYPSFYNHYRNDTGLKGFDSFVYQMAGDDGSFQTNILFNTRASLKKELLEQNQDSLSNLN
jgi:uncharacterized phage-associated protein